MIPTAVCRHEKHDNQGDVMKDNLVIEGKQNKSRVFVPNTRVLMTARVEWCVVMGDEIRWEKSWSF